jgi:dihydroflavonol-4-reductase
VALLLKGKLPGVPSFGYAIFDVRHLAELHVRAMTAPEANGQRYIGAGPFVSMSDIAKILREHGGALAKKVTTRKLPDMLVRLVGLFDPKVGGQLFELGKRRQPSSAKAERQFGWSSRPVEQTILDTAHTLQTVGALI